MPKESVYGELLPYGEESAARSIVEVRWSRSGYFQIATRCVEGTDGETTYRDDPENITFGSLNTSTSVNPPPLTFRDGFYVDLNRDGINDLIRKLRRARDQSFGRDE